MRADIERELYELKEPIESWTFDEPEVTAEGLCDEPAVTIPCSGFDDERTGLPF